MNSKRQTRKPHIRLPEYDYSNNGAYFVTVCARDRKNIFGNINVGAGLASARINVELTPLGNIIDSYWKRIPDQFKNVNIDEYMIMPNRLHGIIIIDDINKREDARPSPTVSDIICAFKSQCATVYLNYVKENELDILCKIWQRSFYDHIIRDEKTLRDIREYIRNNPHTWDIDKENREAAA